MGKGAAQGPAKGARNWVANRGQPWGRHTVTPGRAEGIYQLSCKK